MANERVDRKPRLDVSKTRQTRRVSTGLVTHVFPRVEHEYRLVPIMTPSTRAVCAGVDVDTATVADPGVWDAATRVDAVEVVNESRHPELIRMVVIKGRRDARRARDTQVASVARIHIEVYRAQAVRRVRRRRQGHRCGVTRHLKLAARDPCARAVVHDEGAGVHVMLAQSSRHADSLAKDLRCGFRGLCVHHVPHGRPWVGGGEGVVPEMAKGILTAILAFMDVYAAPVLRQRADSPAAVASYINAA
mmetsp:Transcript_107508/g.302594  ORF Transcript_107508/g.302594 Transcript_107508/m.302594 type:complete len:248 (+) Transcript_107508:906-1649(+)